MARCWRARAPAAGGQRVKAVSIPECERPRAESKPLPAPALRFAVFLYTFLSKYALLIPPVPRAQPQDMHMDKQRLQ